MFYDSLSGDQKEQFVEDRLTVIKDRLASIKNKLDGESRGSKTDSQGHMYSYLENHLKAELSWLKTFKKGEYPLSDVK